MPPPHVGPGLAGAASAGSSIWLQTQAPILVGHPSLPQYDFIGPLPLFRIRDTFSGMLIKYVSLLTFSVTNPNGKEEMGGGGGEEGRRGWGGKEGKHTSRSPVSLAMETGGWMSSQLLEGEGTPARSTLTQALAFCSWSTMVEQ